MYFNRLLLLLRSDRFTNSSILYISEESAYRVLTNEGPDKTHIAGVPIIINTYELHKDNAEVVESIVTLIMELAEYGR